MRKIILMLIGSISLISCGLIEPTSVIDGSYEGEYSITHNYGTDSAYTKEGKITFEFSKGQYKYIGENYYLLPESLGKYSLQRRKFILLDNGRHNASIDPTLLLNGAFDYSFNAKRLILTQYNKGYGYYHKLILYKSQKNLWHWEKTGNE